MKSTKHNNSHILLVAVTALFVLVPYTGLAASWQHVAKQTYLPEINYGDGVIRYSNTDLSGTGTVIAVIDDGIWFEHPDLRGREWDDGTGRSGWNFLNDSDDLTIQGSHGTQVAGLIAGNGIGIRGIARGVKLMNLIACDKKGCPETAVARAVAYALDHGAHVIHMSFGGYGEDGYSTVFDELFARAWDANVMVVAAAGNGNVRVTTPTGQNLDTLPISPVCNDQYGLNTIVGVGSRSPWSNFGSCVDVVAPDKNIFTTMAPSFAAGKEYDVVSGTSFAAPFVTGAIALVREVHPQARNFEIIDQIISTTQSQRLDIARAVTGSAGEPRIEHISHQIAAPGDTLILSGLHFRSSRGLTISGSNQIYELPPSLYRVLDSTRLHVRIPPALPAGTYTIRIQHSVTPGIDITIDPERSIGMSTATVTASVEEHIQSASYPKNTACEQSYGQLIDTDALEFSEHITDDVRDEIVSFVCYGSSDCTRSLGTGERRALIRDYLQTASGDVRWDDIERLASGQKPIHRNLDKERAEAMRALTIFTRIYGRAADYTIPEEDLAWNTLLYRVRFPRDLAKEQEGINRFRSLLKYIPSTPMDWAAVRVLGYVYAQ